MVTKSDKALLWALIVVSILGGLATLLVGFLVDAVL
jgi:hypothetical protein